MAWFQGNGSKNISEIDEFRIPAFRALAVRIFGKFFSAHFGNENTERDLRRAKMGMSRVEFYSQGAFIVTIFSALDLLMIGISYILFPVFRLLSLAIGFFLAVAALSIVLEVPSLVYRSRRRKIDSLLTITMSYFATMASADVPIDIIFRDLGESRQYGEISREARSIWIRSSVFGLDIMSSIREAIRYSPSQRFADFLQGIITTVNSGSNLKIYFTGKAQQYHEELRSEIKRNSDSMGILAESFVAVGVAFPLIFLIIVGVVAYLSPTSTAGYIVILVFTIVLIIPGILAVFAYFFRRTAGEIEI